MSHLLQNPKYKKNNTNILHQDVSYSSEEHKMWEYLYVTQIGQLQNLAHPRILDYLEMFGLPRDSIPQLSVVSKKLWEKSGWQVLRVEDLIDSENFFSLLADRMFPSTIYIRDINELYLSRDPDIFHELFGHCPLLFDADYAKIFEKFGVLGIKLDEMQRGFLQRLFWFTLETGLIRTKNGLKIYGGSLLSSIKESKYAILDQKVVRSEYDMVDLLRTSYRADLMQTKYYIISGFETLHNLLDDESLIKKNIEIAYELGEYPATFPIESKFAKYTSYNLCKKINTTMENCNA